MNNGIKIKAKGINGLKASSKVREFVIQYKLEIKYPNPNDQPIKNDANLPLEKLANRKINKNGNVKKFKKKIL